MAFHSLPGRALGLVLLLVLSLAPRCLAKFTTSFKDAKEGDTLNLSWDDGVSADSYPLIITLSLVNETEDGSAYGLKTDLSTTVTSTPYAWTGIPYPLRYVPTAKYRVEIRPSRWQGSKGDDKEPQPVLASSPFFTIRERGPGGGASPGGDSKNHGQADSPPSKSSSLNHKLAIGLGTSISVAAVVAGTVVGFCLGRRWLRRRRAAKEEARWRRRVGFVIH